MNDRKEREDLLRRARELHERASTDPNEAKRKQSSTVGNMVKDSSWYKKSFSFWAKLTKILGPVGWILNGISKLIRRWFRWAAYLPFDNQVDQARSEDEGISTSRLAKTVPLTILIIILAHVSVSALYYYSTQFEETVYVTGKQEIETGELYQFGGCSSLPCSTSSDTGKFFLIEASPYFPILYYPEEDVFANIPQQNGVCEVKGYGIYFRGLRWIYKSLQLYQHVVNVSCRPYNADEIRQSSEFLDTNQEPKARQD